MDPSKQRTYFLPRDVALVLPGQEFGRNRGMHIDIKGEIYNHTIASTTHLFIYYTAKFI